MSCKKFCGSSRSKPVRHKVAGHAFHRLRRDALEGVLHHRFRKRGTGSKPTEPTQHRGVLKLKREFAIPPASHPLNHDRSQNLLCRYPFASNDVCVHRRDRGRRQAVDDRARPLKLLLQARAGSRPRRLSANDARTHECPFSNAIPRNVEGNVVRRFIELECSGFSPVIPSGYRFRTGTS